VRARRRPLHGAHDLVIILERCASKTSLQSGYTRMETLSALYAGVESELRFLMLLAETFAPRLSASLEERERS